MKSLVKECERELFTALMRELETGLINSDRGRTYNRVVLLRGIWEYKIWEWNERKMMNDGSAHCTRRGWEGVRDGSARKEPGMTMHAWEQEVLEEGEERADVGKRSGRIPS